MCPDRQLISLYKDGELPSPWKEKLESHLAICPDCSKRLAAYHRVSEFLQDQRINEETVGEAQKRAWKNLSRALPQTERITAKHQWKHPVVLPLPVAIAALIVVALVATFISPFIMRQSSANTQSIAKINTEVSGVIPVSDINGVLQYLENQAASADIVIIKLPDSSSFIPSGQPELIRAVDYQRRR